MKRVHCYACHGTGCRGGMTSERHGNQRAHREQPRRHEEIPARFLPEQQTEQAAEKKNYRNMQAPSLAEMCFGQNCLKDLKV